MNCDSYLFNSFFGVIVFVVFLHSFCFSCSVKDIIFVLAIQAFFRLGVKGNGLFPFRTRDL